VWSGNSTRNEYEIISNRPCGQKLHTVRSQLRYRPILVQKRYYYSATCGFCKGYSWLFAGNFYSEDLREKWRLSNRYCLGVFPVCFLNIFVK